MKYIKLFENFKDDTVTFLKTNPKNCVDYILKDVFDIAIDEIGLNKILKYLIKEDSMNFRLSNGLHTKNTIIFHDDVDKLHDESEIDYILRKNKIKYSVKDIKNRFLEYFVRRLMANLPIDKSIVDESEMLKFIKTYTYEFLYNYILKIS